MLTIYGHPISSYTWKVLAALYENDTPFEFVTLDQNTYPDFLAKWPLGTFPVLLDSDRQRMITETSVIIEYLDHVLSGPHALRAQGFRHRTRSAPLGSFVRYDRHDDDQGGHG